MAADSLLMLTSEASWDMHSDRQPCTQGAPLGVTMLKIDFVWASTSRRDAAASPAAAASWAGAGADCWLQSSPENPALHSQFPSLQTPFSLQRFGHLSRSSQVRQAGFSQ